MNARCASNLRPSRFAFGGLENAARRFEGCMRVKGQSRLVFEPSNQVKQFHRGHDMSINQCLIFHHATELKDPGKQQNG